MCVCVHACVGECVCVFYPTRESELQSTAMSPNKTVRWKKHIWPQQENRNMFILTSGLRTSGLQRYASSCYSQSTSGSVGLLISKHTFMHEVSTGPIFAAFLKFDHSSSVAMAGVVPCFYSDLCLKEGFSFSLIIFRMDPLEGFLFNNSIHFWCNIKFYLSIQNEQFNIQCMVEIQKVSKNRNWKENTNILTWNTDMLLQNKNKTFLIIAPPIDSHIYSMHTEREGYGDPSF